MTNTEIFYKAVDYYLQQQPLLLTDLLASISQRVDHELTVPRCSPQNGVAERAILRLTIMVRHALISRCLEPIFWADAFDFAAHVSWLLPTHANPGDVSPWQQHGWP